MNYVNEEILVRERISISNLLKEIGSGEAREEILRGLQQEEKYISSKFFYNKRGSELFIEITGLPEYYPTRTEKQILETIAPDLMQRHRGYELMELGPGDASKISILMREAKQSNQDPLRYLPLDISRSALRDLAAEVTGLFPRVEVEGYALDFMSQFEVLDRPQPLLICFLGSTIGNLEGAAAVQLLANISAHMKKDDTLLLGTDLIKDEAVLHAAYNDEAGVTRVFNLNILQAVNELAGTDFDLLDFDHLAFFNREAGRIEMHLVAKRTLEVRSPYLESPLLLKKGEHIHTENSHKYTAARIADFARKAGLEPVRRHSDDKSWFALSEFTSPFEEPR